MAGYREWNVDDGQAPTNTGAGMDTEGTFDEASASSPEPHDDETERAQAANETSAEHAWQDRQAQESRAEEATDDRSREPAAPATITMTPPTPTTDSGSLKRSGPDDSRIDNVQGAEVGHVGE